MADSSTGAHLNAVGKLGGTLPLRPFRGRGLLQPFCRRNRRCESLNLDAVKLLREGLVHDVGESEISIGVKSVGGDGSPVGRWL
jgi:hypothetical protein